MNIYFATNRNISKVEPVEFGDGFSLDDLGDVRFGQVNVKDGEIDKKSIKLLSNNPKEGSQELFSNLRKKMRDDSKDSLIFIHGFNVTFVDAIESAAKMAEKYKEKKYEPNIFVFSWPSDGKLFHYSNDRYDAEVSGYAFARGLLKLSSFLKKGKLEEICNQKVHLIAHSMGNYVLRHSLQQAQEIGKGKALPRIFDEIILTAADEDNDAFEFESKFSRLPSLAKRITVYFNSGDLALKTSDYTKGNPDRLGHDGPSKPHKISSKVVLVDASSVVGGVAEHSYHQEEKLVIEDIVAVLQGISSENITGRKYVPHANKFKL